MIITGGTRKDTIDGLWSWSRDSRVTAYNNDGFVADLPSLNQARSDHGCGHFVNSENKKVINTYYRLHNRQD